MSKPAAPSKKSPLRILARPVAGIALFVAVAVALLGWCTCMPGQSHKAPLPELTPEQLTTQKRLEAHLQKLAVELVPRNLSNPAQYKRAQDYLYAQLEAMQVYDMSTALVEHPAGPAYNIVAQLKGGDLANEVIVIGAHYDSHHDTPGADDNASGSAALIEIARAFAAQRVPPRRTVRFVLYANEEPPYFKGPAMGSVVDAEALRVANVDVKLMVSLEMLGYYDDAPHTQVYPPVLSWFYPDTGNFVTFVGKLGDRGRVRCAVDLFRKSAAFPSEGFAGPRFIEGLDYSDHWAYWEQGYAGIMITDTSFFRNAHYHKLTDTPETLNFPYFARVVQGLERSLWHWAQADACAG